MGISLYLVLLILIVFVLIGFFPWAKVNFGVPVTGPTPTGNETSPQIVVTYITATTGLISALAGLYGQVIAGKKLRAELDLMKNQNATKRKEAKLKKDTKGKTSKKTAKQKSEQIQLSNKRVNPPAKQK